MASNPAYSASLAEQPLHAGRLNPATDAGLPPEVADLLRQRGVAGGAVLLLSGGESAALNLFFLYCFRTLLHFPDAIAVAATYILGTLVHFPAHRWITYNAQHRPIRPQGVRYAVMLVCNFMILQALVALASRLSISPYLAYMASTGCTMVFNFLVMTHIVFAKGHDHGE